MTGDLAMTMPLVTVTLAELHATGKIKLLAVTSPQRLDVVPDVPTAIEAGVPNMVAAEFFYLFAPTGTPEQVLHHLNNTARAALTDDAFKNKLKNAGFDPQFAGNLDATRRMFEIRAGALVAGGGSLRRQNQLERSISAGPQGMNDASGQAGLRRETLRSGKSSSNCIKAAAAHRCFTCTADRVRLHRPRSSPHWRAAFG